MTILATTIAMVIGSGDTSYSSPSDGPSDESDDGSGGGSSALVVTLWNPDG